jgi:hypothetical protein
MFALRTTPARPSTGRGAHPCSPRVLPACLTPPAERVETRETGGPGTSDRPRGRREERPDRPDPLPAGRRGGLCFRLRPAKITARNSLRTCRLSRRGSRERSRGDWCREWEQRTRLTEYYYKTEPKCITLASTERDRETVHSVDEGPISGTPGPVVLPFASASPPPRVVRPPGAAKRARLHSGTEAHMPRRAATDAFSTAFYAPP